MTEMSDSSSIISCTSCDSDFFEEDESKEVRSSKLKKRDHFLKKLFSREVCDGSSVNDPFHFVALSLSYFTIILTSLFHSKLSKSKVTSARLLSCPVRKIMTSVVDRPAPNNNCLFLCQNACNISCFFGSSSFPMYLQEF